MIATKNGAEALSVLESENAPPLAVLDWMMPEIDGLEVCRRVRLSPSATPPYIIFLTAKSSKADIVQGFEAGANDYVIKPFDRMELQARVKVGETVVNLQRSLAVRVEELEKALGQSQTTTDNSADLFLLQAYSQRQKLLGTSRNLHFPTYRHEI